MGCCAEYVAPILTAQAADSYTKSWLCVDALGLVSKHAVVVISDVWGGMSYRGESEGVTGPTTPRLLDQVRARLRLKHYNLHTERVCVD